MTAAPGGESSLLASAVAVLGHLLFAFAAAQPARRGGGPGRERPLPRAVSGAFSRLAFGLAAWSGAHFLRDLLPELARFELPWIAAAALPALGLSLAAALVRSRRLVWAEWIGWLGALVAATAALLFRSRAVPVVAALFFPSAIVALVALRVALRLRGQPARPFLIASGVCLAAGLWDHADLLGFAPTWPRLTMVASVAIVAALGSSVARHRLFALEPLLGRLVTIGGLAFGLAVLLGAALDRIELPWGRRLLVWLALAGLAFGQGFLRRALRSPRARQLSQRRRDFGRRLARHDELLARAASLRELARELQAELAADPEITFARVELGGRRRAAAPGRQRLVLRVVGRRVGAIELGWRERRFAHAAEIRRALRAFAGRAGVAIGALELRSRRRKTERLARLGTLAAGLAHEIKNPLGAILGALDLLDAPDGTTLAAAESARWLDVIRQEARRLDRVVTDALALGREPRLELAEIGVAELLAGVVLLARGRAGAEAATIEVAPANGLAPLRADADLLRHALLNLVLNGVAVQPRGGRVGLAAVERVAAGERTVEFHVRDDGPGIPDALRAKIFEPFFTTRPSGSGLGLLVAQRIASAHGGRLELAAPDGGFGGAHFVLRLPAARLAQEP